MAYNVGDRVVVKDYSCPDYGDLVTGAFGKVVRSTGLSKFAKVKLIGHTVADKWDKLQSKIKEDPFDTLYFEEKNGVWLFTEAELEHAD